MSEGEVVYDYEEAVGYDVEKTDDLRKEEEEEVGDWVREEFDDLGLMVDVHLEEELGDLDWGYVDELLSEELDDYEMFENVRDGEIFEAKELNE